MSFWDVIKPAAHAFMEAGEEQGEHALQTAGGVPGIGTIIHGGQALYHTGCAAYDMSHGDRDGAIRQGTEAIYDGLGAIPSVGAAESLAEIGTGVPLTFAKLASDDPEDVPESVGDGLGRLAAHGADALLGAPKETPTGTRGGEVAAGLETLAFGTNVATALADPITAPIGLGLGYLMHKDITGDGPVHHVIENGLKWTADPELPLPGDGKWTTKPTTGIKEEPFEDPPIERVPHEQEEQS